MGKQLISILKVFGVIAGSVTTLWFAFSWADNLNDSIEDVATQVEQSNSVVLNRLGKMEANIDSLYIIERKRDESEQDIKTMIQQTEGRLIYYIKHEGNMTSEQILDAFELGLDIGKKKELTVFDLLGGTP